MSTEEIRKAISEVTGIPIAEVPEMNFEDELSKIKNHSFSVEQIIKEYKTKLGTIPGVNQDKYEALNDLGRLIYAADNKLNVYVPEKVLKFPDVILLFEDQKIGVEHTRLMDEETKASFKTAKYVIQKAQERIANELNYLSKTVNIFIDSNAIIVGENNFKNRKFSIEERNRVTEIIANYIKSEFVEGNIPKPNFSLELR